MLYVLKHFQAFAIGACIGSFLNVVIYRLPNNLSIVKPRSFCPQCKKNLTWSENIPLISWLMQKGQCFNCKRSISFRYPLVEFTTGIFFVIFVDSSPTVYSSNSNFLINMIFSWAFLSILICISMIDIDRFWIPQGLINFGFISGLIGLISVKIVNNQFIDLFLVLKSILFSAIAFLIFESFRHFAKYIYKKDAIGKGDSKLVAMLALWLGPLGTIFAIGFSYIIAAIYALVGLTFKFLRLRQVIPFAPFLSIGGLIVWFLGNNFILEKILRI